MILKCLGSGSQQGNCYLLDSRNEVLILDAGIPIKQIKKGLNWDISKVVGVLCSHAHLDHAKAVKDFENMGIQMFNPKYLEILCDGKYPERFHVRYGDFDVNAFALTDKNGKFMHTNNDGSECPCYGFLIEHEDMGKLLYITDTELVKWRFSGINHILISCNYQKKYISDSAKRNHVLRGHMELETVKDFIKANKSNALRTVILCHMSGDSCNVEECFAEVQNVCGEGVNVVVVRKDLEVELSLYPF